MSISRASLVVALLSCAAAHGATRYRLTGTTINDADGRPVPFSRITVSLQPEAATENMALQAQHPGLPPERPIGLLVPNAQSLPIESTVTSDAQGHFQIELPQAGAWLVHAIARGFHDQVFEEHDGFSAAAVITEEAPSVQIVFRMSPNAVIEGEIFDEAGEPVEAAQVHAEPAAEISLESTELPQDKALTTTDDRGHYELANLPRGSYRIKVQGHPWYARSGPNDAFGRGSTPADPSAALDPSLDVVYPTTWFPGTTEEDQAGIVTVEAGEDRELSLQLTPVPAVHLRGTMNDSGPAHGGLGRGNFISLAAEGSYTTTAARHGNEWEFGSLAPGSYELNLPRGRGGAGAETRHVEVIAGSPLILGLEASTPLVKVAITVDGVAGEPAPQIVFVDPHAGRRVPATSSGLPTGPTRIGRVAAANSQLTAMLLPGSYQVRVAEGSSAYLDRMVATGAQVAGRTVTVGAETEAKLQIRLAAGRAAVNGIATKSRKACVGAMVLLVPATLGQPDSTAFIERDETNTDGSFALAGVVPGRYILLAIEDAWRLRWTDPQVLAPYLARGVPIDLKRHARVRQEIVVQQR